MSDRMKRASDRRQRRGTEELRNDILQAAAELFLEEGYGNASIEALIDRVGGSKRAIYSHFGGKKELFAALVAQASNQVVDALPDQGRDPCDLRGTLVMFGRQVTTVLMAPTTLALYRTVIAEGFRQPDVAQAFFSGGPGRASKSLAEVLEPFRARGEITVSDCRRAAENFIGMLRDDLHLQVVLGLRDPPDSAEIDAVVSDAVDTFLNGIVSRLPGR